MAIHVVQENDTIYSIAKEYQVSADRLMLDNEIQNPERLVLGQALLVLQPKEIHIVQQGESLYSIAESYGLSINTLIQYNPSIAISGRLYPGDEVVLSYQGEKLGRYFINGYAYPFIDKGLLWQTLPYLSYLSIFSYGFYPDGSLRPTDDKELLRAAHQTDTAPILVLTPSDDNGNFSNQLAGEMLNSPAARNNLIENLVVVMKEKGYYGVDIDFEYILPQDRQAFVDFVQQTHERMAQEGLLVFVALAPKTAAEQKGLLYESHDYPALSQNADLVLLMTYEWGYAYGPPMAVAPINKVRQVLDYAITEIPPEKISMGIPNYGYDWTLPFIPGESRAPSIGNTEAIQLAMTFQAAIRFDETAQSPYFPYTTPDGYLHIVWFEDVRSIQVKLETAAEYGFSGVGYWNLMRPFRQNWMLAAVLYDIVKFKQE